MSQRVWRCCVAGIVGCKPTSNRKRNWQHREKKKKKKNVQYVQPGEGNKTALASEKKQNKCPASGWECVS